jgi:hypothetical protein
VCFAGPDLPQAAWGEAMVPTPDGTGVVLIGGANTEKDLYELKCSSRSCNWKKPIKQLSVPRFYVVALLVPDTFALCKH